jgi:hypothetical protein
MNEHAIIFNNGVRSTPCTICAGDKAKGVQFPVESIDPDTGVSNDFCLDIFICSDCIKKFNDDFKNAPGIKPDYSWL